MDDQRYTAAPNVVFDVDGDTALLLNDAGTHLISLNSIGTLLWRRLDEPRTSTELVGYLATKFPDVPVAQLEHDCVAFVRELSSNGLVHAVG